MSSEDIASNYESLQDHELRIKELEGKVREFELQIDMINHHLKTR